MGNSYSEINSKIEKDKKVIAIALYPSKDLAVFYKGMLIFLKGVTSRGYQTIFLTINDACNGNSYLQKEGFGNIFECSPDDYKEFDFVDCFIVWDWCTFAWNFPDNSKIVTLQHFFYFSPPANIVSLFGYRTDYSFLIRGNKNEYVKDAKNISNGASINFPYAMLKRNSCLIPGGYPEIDALFNSYHKSQESKYITFCTTGAVNNVRLLPDYGAKIIAQLMESFPEYTIVFRPTPSDREMEYVKFIKNTYEVFDNFKIDLGDLQDTINKTQIMISVSTGLKEVFAIVTSTPYIHCDFSSAKKSIIKELLGYKIFNVSDLIPLIKQILKGEQIAKEVIDSCQANLGCSGKYLLDNISYVLEEKENPEWFYYENQCEDKKKTIDTAEDYLPYILKFIGDISFRSLSMKIIDFGLQDFPESALLLGIKGKLHFYNNEIELAKVNLTKANVISEVETAKTIDLQFKAEGFADKTLRSLLRRAKYKVLRVATKFGQYR